MSAAIDPFDYNDERYARILELAVDAIICIDSQQKIVLFNIGAEHTFGYSSDEILGRGIDVLIPQRFRSGHAGHVRQFADGPASSRNMSERQAIYALRKSGEEFPAEATISKISVAAGFMLTVVLRDVTERFRAEELRRKDAEKLQRALAAGHLGAFEQNLQSHNIRLYGDAQDILGIPNPECHRDDLRAIVHEDDVGKLTFVTAEEAGQEQPHVDCRIRKPDQTIAWVRFAASIYRQSQQDSYVFGTVQDITYQKSIEIELERRVADRTKALEEEVKQKEEAQTLWMRAQRMEAFGQLTGGIAHDFNNLLTVVGGNLELLEEGITGERQKKQLARAMSAVEMGARLTQRLLTFARRSKLEPQSLNLNEQIVSMVDILRRTIGESITISSVLAPDLGRVRADPSEVENAILNLAINARDAMPEGGKLVIETANVTVDAAFGKMAQLEKFIPGDYVQLTVYDTGIGMPPEVLARVFEPFFTTKEHGRGTGLGLATIYGFARQSGGHVMIDSEVGQGTTVNIYLPRTERKAAALSSESPVANTLTGRLVLLVEDNPDVREVTLERLLKLGYEVVACESGPAAIEILRTRKGIDLVFSDIMMPGGMSGYDLADWIAINTPSTPVLLTSGFDDTRRKISIAGKNTQKILLKPYAVAELVTAIRDTLGVD